MSPSARSSPPGRSGPGEVSAGGNIEVGRTDRLTTADAARVLGVKEATVYAYVARGLLPRLDSAPGERGSRFARRDIEALAAGAPRRRPKHPELVISTNITSLANGALHYRGRAIGDLVHLPFETVAELLWTGDLVGATPRWHAGAAQLALVQSAHRLVPDASPADRLRVATAALGAGDPLGHDLRPAAVVATARTVLAALAGVGSGGRDEALADAVVRTLGLGAPWRPAVNTALVLLADHELATSTVAVRVAASVRAPLTACLATGLAAVSGSLHGSASALVHRLFSEAATCGADAAVAQTLRSGGMLPGLGHAVYRGGDPRFGLLMATLANVDTIREGTATVRAVLELATSRAATFPNIDFALGALSFLAGLQPTAGEALFATARLAGWTAHAMEEYREEPLRFRVRSGR